VRDGAKVVGKVGVHDIQSATEQLLLPERKRQFRQPPLGAIFLDVRKSYPSTPGAPLLNRQRNQAVTDREY